MTLDAISDGGVGPADLQVRGLIGTELPDDFVS